MDEFATMSCSKWASCPDDILILTCDHNLCLICACKNLQRERLKSAQEVRSVTCDICGTSTILDPESAAELLQVYVEEDPPEETYSYKPTPVSMRLCLEHDEPIQYFCLSCECACICAECVIHGQHRNWDVLNIKKAYPMIREKLSDLSGKVSNKIERLQHLEQSFSTKDQDIEDKTRQVSQQIQAAFEDLRVALDKKERDLVASVQGNQRDCSSEIEAYIRLIAEKVDEMARTVNEINWNINGQEQQALIDFYVDEKTEIMRILESEDTQITSAEAAIQSQVAFPGIADELSTIKAFTAQVSGEAAQAPSSADKYNPSSSGRFRSFEKPRRQ